MQLSDKSTYIKGYELFKHIWYKLDSWLWSWKLVGMVKVGKKLNELEQVS